MCGVCFDIVARIVMCVVVCTLCCGVVWCGGAACHAENPPCVDSKRLRVCVQDASVCTGKTSACVEHAGVFPVHTEAS